MAKDHIVSQALARNFLRKRCNWYLFDKNTGEVKCIKPSPKSLFFERDWIDKSLDKKSHRPIEESFGEFSKQRLRGDSFDLNQAIDREGQEIIAKIMYLHWSRSMFVGDIVDSCGPQVIDQHPEATPRRMRNDIMEIQTYERFIGSGECHLRVIPSPIPLLLSDIPVIPMSIPSNDNARRKLYAMAISRTALALLGDRELIDRFCGNDFRCVNAALVFIARLHVCSHCEDTLKMAINHSHERWGDKIFESFFGHRFC